ncbi:MAG TPA: M28 family peptidase [Acidobacteriaceae bacterium]|jgi:Zn-dependent M28 family amino/carboxypeptidase
MTCSILRRSAVALLVLALPLSLHAQAHPVSGQTVMKLTQDYLNVAPKRYVGSPGHTKAEEFIRGHFAPEAAKGNFVVDEFYANTPAGNFPMRNLIVKFPGKKDGIIVLASHYETNYPLKDINFVGANDGACTTALLIALGDYYRQHPPQGYSVWLVFFDGEEAIHEWSDTDSLYGSRHLAAKWSGDGTLSHVQAFVLADMIGAKDLNVDFDEESTPALRDLLKTAARDSGHTSYLYKNTVPGLGDDHIPFQKRGVPVLDIIDIDYGPPTREHPEGGYHHTVQDTMDKLSASSLQVSADLFVGMVRLIDTHCARGTCKP